MAVRIESEGAMCRPHFERFCRDFSTVLSGVVCSQRPKRWRIEPLPETEEICDFVELGINGFDEKKTCNQKARILIKHEDL